MTLTVASRAANVDAGAMNGKQIIVVDDDQGLRALVADYLRSHDFQVREADSMASLRAHLAEKPADCITLDIMMPEEDGLTGLRDIGGQGAAVIILSTMASDVDRIVGLELGADDYVTKPCNPRELLARIRAVLRRRAPPAESEPVSDAAPQWVLDSQHWRMTAPDGARVDMSAAELRLMAVLVRANGRVLSRDQLLEATRTDGEFYDRAIDVAISRMRGKLAPLGGADLIRTVRGEGYALGMPIRYV